MKVAIIYDRVNKWGGAERVLLALHEIFPDAPLYTSVYSPEKAKWASVFPEVIPSFLNKVPYLTNRHEYLGWITPLAFEQFNFDKYDLVISVTSEAAKGVITRGKTKHICYCLTPTRYLWSHYATYFKGESFKGITRPVVSYLRKWDVVVAQRPDVFVAISTEVQSRIKKYYNRDSVVIHPPLALSLQSSRAKGKEPRDFQSRLGRHIGKRKYYLIVSRLVPYKRVDLAIETLNKLGTPLYIVGVGREEQKLKKLAKSNVKFLGELTDGELARYYKNAKALILPQEEDFGLVAVESIASGTPVIAYKAGGALDIIEEGQNGLFFDKQDKESLAEAIKRFEKLRFNSRIISRDAKRFSKKVFRKKFLDLVENVR